jgi:hypothetical protein
MSDDELPDINVTRGEKLLAGVLAAFLLVGGLWIYFVPLDRDAAPARPTPAQQQAIDAYETVQSDKFIADERLDERQVAYEEAREEYRTELDADAPAAASRRAFETARDRLNDARREAEDLAAQMRRLQPAADRAQAQLQRRDEDASSRAERTTTLLRLGWVLATIALAFWLFNTLRRRRSPYFVAGVATVIAATIQALVMAFDYLGDEIDLEESGPLVIAIAGVIASLLALIGLERYLARRAPRRRVRKGQCPYCAYPQREGATHCEGCGRATIAACATCQADRRVGTPHCGACGAT